MTTQILDRISHENVLRSHLCQSLIFSRELYATCLRLGYSPADLRCLQQIAATLKATGKELDKLPPPPRQDDFDLFTAALRDHADAMARA